jgi:hypothetical protein
MPYVHLAGPLLEEQGMNSYERTHFSDPEPLTHYENMIDGLTASSILKLPYFWFKNPTQRRLHRIPHYCFLRFVRFRTSEITQWAQEYRKVNSKGASAGLSAGGNDA